MRILASSLSPNSSRTSGSSSCTKTTFPRPPRMPPRPSASRRQGQHRCPRKASRFGLGARHRTLPAAPNRARRGRTPRHRGACPLRAPKDATPLGERTDRTRAPPSRLPSASRAKNPCASDMPPCASSKPPTKSIKTAGAHRRTARRNSQSHQVTRGYARVRISSRTFAQKSSIVEGCVSFVRSRTEMVPRPPSRPRSPWGTRSMERASRIL